MWDGCLIGSLIAGARVLSGGRRLIRMHVGLTTDTVGLRGRGLVVVRIRVGVGRGSRRRWPAGTRRKDKFGRRIACGLFKEHVAAGAVDERGDHSGRSGGPVVAVDPLFRHATGDAHAGAASDGAKDAVEAGVLGVHFKLSTRALDLGAMRAFAGMRCPQGDGCDGCGGVGGRGCCGSNGWKRGWSWGPDGYLGEDTTRGQAGRQQCKKSRTGQGSRGHAYGTYICALR